MKLAMIGLGRMGSNMVRRLLRDRHECIVYDQNPAQYGSLTSAGAVPVRDLKELKSKLTSSPRIVWVMLPAGDATETTVLRLQEILDDGDMVIDGGNSYFKDDVRRSKSFTERGMYYLDVGVGGGVWGLERGYCMMIGGNAEVVPSLDPILRTLASSEVNIPISMGRETIPIPQRQGERGYIYCGPSGSGHFVKMIHNGIEYGMMQALAEGFHLLEGAGKETLPQEYRYELNLTEIAEVWRRGSVVSSWLLDLVANSLNQDPKLADFEGQVGDSGEGRWTVAAALEEGVPAEIITSALFIRFRSRETRSFAEKMLSAMRNQFGGHLENKKSGE